MLTIKVCLCVLLLQVASTVQKVILSNDAEGDNSTDLKKNWWKERVLYQIYPWSFYDSDGDGIGDLEGIRRKLDHFNSLGKEQFAVWISPFFKSPMKDFGYDIQDFRDIDPRFGTMDDFDKLAKEMKQKNIPLFLDLVPNHSSDLHVWFNQSRHHVPGFEDYYVWADGENNSTTKPPNNWLNAFNGKSWTYCHIRKQWYLHQFLKEQPDLNYRNPKVQEEMKNIIRFWLNKDGVMGFRVDAIAHLVEAASMQNESRSYMPGVTNETDYEYLYHNLTRNQPETFTILREWRKVLDEFEKKDGWTRAMYLEVYEETHLMIKYYGTKEEPISQFAFNMHFVGLNANATAKQMHQIADDYLKSIPNDTSPNWVIGNHDRFRIGTHISRVRINAMHSLIQLIRGVAVTYYGEEIGMVNHPNISFEQTKDPWGKLQGKERYAEFSRDPERTPMQWSNTSTAGFSTNTSAETWLPLNPNYQRGITVQDELTDTSSHLNYYKELIKIRDTYTKKMYSEETMKWVYVTEDILSFVRTDRNQTASIIVAFNWNKKGEILSDLTSQKERWENEIKLPENGTVLIFNRERECNCQSPVKGDTVSLKNIKLHGGEVIIMNIDVEHK